MIGMREALDECLAPIYIQLTPIPELSTRLMISFTIHP